MASWNLDDLRLMSQFFFFLCLIETLMSPFAAKTDATPTRLAFGTRRREGGSASTCTTWLGVSTLVWVEHQVVSHILKSMEQTTGKGMKTLQVVHMATSLLELRHQLTIAERQRAALGLLCQSRWTRVEPRWVFTLKRKNTLHGREYSCKKKRERHQAQKAKHGTGKTKASSTPQLERIKRRAGIKKRA